MASLYGPSTVITGLRAFGLTVWVVVCLSKETAYVKMLIPGLSHRSPHTLSNCLHFLFKYVNTYIVHVESPIKPACL